VKKNTTNNRQKRLKKCQQAPTELYYQFYNFVIAFEFNIKTHYYARCENLKKMNHQHPVSAVPDLFFILILHVCAIKPSIYGQIIITLKK